MAHHYLDNPSKRRRISIDRDSPTRPGQLNIMSNGDHEAHIAPEITVTNSEQSKEMENISISSTTEQARQAIVPFLAKHIPEQYAPRSTPIAPTTDNSKKYCNRHRPDLRCRRQVNEPSMDQLQSELEPLSENDKNSISTIWSLFSASPSKHRDLILRGLVAQCCFPELSSLHNSVREAIKIDFLSALPNELGLKIICYLDTASLCKAGQVCRNWRQLADDDIVWRRMCQQHLDRKCDKCGWGLPKLEQKRLREGKRQTQLRANGRGLNVWSPELTPLPDSGPSMVGTGPGDEPSASKGNQINEHPGKSYFVPQKKSWKEMYRDRFKIGANWRHGRYSTRIFRGHTNGIMCLQFNDSILATGSYDTTIKIWDIASGHELRTLRGHRSGLRCLQFDDTKLWSGGLDRTLKMWNYHTGELLRTLRGHHDGVIALHFVSTLMASGSMDQTVRIWNFGDSSQRVLRGHSDWVNSVKIDLPSRTIFSASDDLTVRLWDLDSCTTLRIFDGGHVGQVQQIVFLPHDFEYDVVDEAGPSSDDASSIHSPGNEILQPSHDSTDIWEGFECAMDITTPPTSPARPRPPRYILTAGLDSTIRLWDTYLNRCLRTFFGHVEGVWALAADKLRVVSGAQDRMVKVWDARTARCEATFTGHAGPVTCIGLSDDIICTGSEDGEARMLGFGVTDG